MYIDAAYVINGLNSKTRHYSQGANGDLWTKIYQVASDKNLNIVKVKSHVTNGDQWTAYNMTAEAYLYNELADEVCTQASKLTARAADDRKEDGKQYRLASQAAARIATIEASIWASNPVRIHFDGTDYTKLFEARNAAVKRKFDETIINTNGGRAHETFARDGWIRCRHCTSKAKPGNIDYWHHTACHRLAIVIKQTARERDIQAFRAYMDKPENERARLDRVACSEGQPWQHQEAPDNGLDSQPHRCCEECMTGSDIIKVIQCPTCRTPLCADCITHHNECSSTKRPRSSSQHDQLENQEEDVSLGRQLHITATQHSPDLNTTLRKIPRNETCPQQLQQPHLVHVPSALSSSVSATGEGGADAHHQSDPSQPGHARLRGEDGATDATGTTAAANIESESDDDGLAEMVWLHSLGEPVSWENGMSPEEARIILRKRLQANSPTRSQPGHARLGGEDGNIDAAGTTSAANSESEGDDDGLAEMVWLHSLGEPVSWENGMDPERARIILRKRLQANPPTSQATKRSRAASQAVAPTAASIIQDEEEIVNEDITTCSNCGAHQQWHYCRECDGVQCSRCIPHQQCTHCTSIICLGCTMVHHNTCEDTVPLDDSLLAGSSNDHTTNQAGNATPNGSINDDDTATTPATQQQIESISDDDRDRGSDDGQHDEPAFPNPHIADLAAAATGPQQPLTVVAGPAGVASVVSEAASNHPEPQQGAHQQQQHHQINKAGKEEKAACTTATASQIAATTQHAAATATKPQQPHMAFVFSVTGAADAEAQHQPTPSRSGYGLSGRNDCEDEAANAEAASQQKDAMTTLLACHPEQPKPMQLTAAQTKRVLSSRQIALTRAGEKAAKQRAEVIAAAMTEQIAASRAAAIERQKAKIARESATASSINEVVPTAKRNYSLAFDDSQGDQEEEPPPTQPQPSPPTPEATKKQKQEEGAGNKKRKNVGDIIKGINEKVKKTRAEKTEEYQAQLNQRTAAPPTKAATWVRNEAASGIEGMGYSRIHPSHQRYRLAGDVTFCWRCGYWMKTKSQNLQKTCDPNPVNMSSHQKSMRNKLRQGLYPQAKDGPVKTWKDGTSTSKPVPLERLDFS